MADKSVRGRFVWHELITPDTEGAHAFYSKALGWKTQAWERDPSYTMFLTSGGPLGGTWGRPSEAARWLPYIGTDHIEGTVDQARSLGARVLKDVTEMPNGGKYALLEDPQGAAFGVYVSPHEPALEGTAKLGEYSWHELATDDYRAAFEFYSALFGWEEAGQHDMGAPLGVYFMFGRGGQAIGGMFKKMPEMPGGPSWLGYVRVKDVNQTIKKATSAGGTLVTGPMEVPGGDLIAQFTDPQGAVFAVHTFASDIKGRSQVVEVAADEQAVSEPADTEVQAAATGTARREAGEQAAEKVAKQATKKAAKKEAKKTSKKAAKKVAKKAAKKPAKKAAKQPAKTAQKTAGKKKAAKKPAAKKSAVKKRPAKSAKKKVVSKTAAKKKSAAKKKGVPAKKSAAAKKRTAAKKSSRAKSATVARGAKRSAGKSAKAKRSAQKASSARASARKRVGAKKQARKAK